MSTVASLRQLAVVRRAGRRVRGGLDVCALHAAFRESYRPAPASAACWADRARWYEAIALGRKALRAFARAPLSPLPARLAAEAQCALEESW